MSRAFYAWLFGVNFRVIGIVCFVADAQQGMATGHPTILSAIAGAFYVVGSALDRVR